MKITVRKWMAATVISGMLSGIAAAEQTAAIINASAIYGEYEGMVGSHDLLIQIYAAADGTLSIQLGSKEDGLAATNVKFDGRTLHFEDPPDNGVWEGTVSSDGSTLTGYWDEGNGMGGEVTWVRVPSAAPAAAH